MSQLSGNDPKRTSLGEHLLDQLRAIHNYLRYDLEICQSLARDVAAGAAPRQVKAEVESLQARSPIWKLRVGCLQYCSFVHGHHGHEDAAFFPALAEANPGIRPVIERLMSDHKKVSGLLDEVEASAEVLLAVEGPVTRGRVAAALDALATELLTHLAFEEEALGPTILSLEEYPS